MERCLDAERHFSLPDALLNLTAGLFGLVSGQLMSLKLVSQLTPATALQAMIFATLVGMLCGVTIRRHFEWSVVWFVVGFCLGEFVGLRPVPFLGDTLQKFVLSVATLNLAPLVAACGMYPGHEIQKVLYRREIPVRR